MGYQITVECRQGEIEEYLKASVFGIYDYLERMIHGKVRWLTTHETAAPRTEAGRSATQGRINNESNINGVLAVNEARINHANWIKKENCGDPGRRNFRKLLKRCQHNTRKGKTRSALEAGRTAAAEENNGGVRFRKRSPPPSCSALSEAGLSPSAGTLTNKFSLVAPLRFVAAVRRLWLS